MAGSVILARIVPDALVYVQAAVSALPVGFALTGVGVDAVDTGGTMLTKVARTIINVLLTVVPFKS